MLMSAGFSKGKIQRKFLHKLFKKFGNIFSEIVVVLVSEGVQTCSDGFTFRMCKSSTTRNAG